MQIDMVLVTFFYMTNLATKASSRDDVLVYRLFISTTYCSPEAGSSVPKMDTDEEDIFSFHSA